MTDKSNEDLPNGRLAQRVPAEHYGENPAMTLTVGGPKMKIVKARLLNISETGMAVRTDQELVLGQMVTIAAKGGEKMPHRAVVMWSCREDTGFRAGLRFAGSL
jgi:hypothetical protein